MEKVARVRGSEARPWSCITHMDIGGSLGLWSIFETLPPDKAFGLGLCFGHAQLHVFFPI